MKSIKKTDYHKHTAAGNGIILQQQEDNAATN